MGKYKIWILPIGWVIIVLGFYLFATVRFTGDVSTGFGVITSILSAKTSNFSDFASYFAGLIVAPLAAFFALRQWKESRAALQLQREIALQELHNAEIQDFREALSNVQQRLGFMKMNNIQLACVCSERKLSWGQVIHSNLLNDCCVEDIRESLAKDINFLNFYNEFNGKLNEYGMLLCMLSRTKFSDLLLSQYVTDYGDMVRLVVHYDFAKIVRGAGQNVTNLEEVRDSLIGFLRSPANSHREQAFIDRMLIYLTAHLTNCSS